MNLESKISIIERDLNNAPWKKFFYDYHRSYFDECLKHVLPDKGLWVEFGVYRGRSISYISEKTDNIVYGFDSFEGLNEYWDKDNPKGVYNLAGEIPIGAIDGENGENPGMYDSSPSTKVKPWNKNIKLIKGYFEDSLPNFLENNNEKLIFVHIDSDLYSSAKTVLSLLKDRFIDGTVICFDDLMDYSVNKNNEVVAFAEFLLETGFDYEVLAYQIFDTSIYRQGCFKIKK